MPYLLYVTRKTFDSSKSQYSFLNFLIAWLFDHALQMAQSSWALWVASPGMEPWINRQYKNIIGAPLRFWWRRWACGGWFRIDYKVPWRLPDSSIPILRTIRSSIPFHSTPWEQFGIWQWNLLFRTHSLPHECLPRWMLQISLID